MFGFSVFLNKPLSSETKQYIEKMAHSGFTGVFTSLHIPEDNNTQYRKRLIELGNITKLLNLDLMVDISGSSLQKAGFSMSNINEIRSIGVTGLRADDYISNKCIAQLSNKITIALNASTITENDIQELKLANANFDQLEAWHNYYPRPETGLDEEWYRKKAKWLKSFGLKSQAFVSGDNNLRGPLYQGLPTLEKHRAYHPLAASLDLLSDTNKIFIGDPGLSDTVIKQFANYIHEKNILLHVDPFNNQIDFTLGEHINRLDESRDVIRSAYSRKNKIPNIKPLLNIKRDTGSVTIDNSQYLRYMGEIQITKRSLPADEKVNVVGQISQNDRCLIPHIKGGQKFTLLKNDIESEG
ncbi:Outer surface protein of unknown function, cellobiose operon [Staphylococcus schleiferi]|uniref:DUF871 domain-containing protein n=1 Tax=Staphylococcus coagulans TaxID=74706 RepID=UPI0006BCFE18|nr:MupG family TIM beta-alpha barrel fold protein [Staphylococcus coagulans]PNZ10732.1 DUF871 domain-containing protein [Staphylococcus coagulans]BAS44939.1 Outer surface protein of unknown function, cellobiose operon [Staphylococcus schleiferi]